MKKYLLVLLLLLSANVMAGAKQQYQQFMQDLGSLSARFEQFVLDVDNAKSGQFSGTFYLQRPEKFRWEYERPYKQHILADGRWLWWVDEDLEQVTQQFQDSALKGTPAQLLINSDLLETDYEAIDLGVKSDMEWLELVPRAEDSPFVRILMAFHADTLRRLEMTDQFGKISRFIFSDLKRNPTLDKKLFKFEPPPGYDLLSQ